ncbi:MAG: OmpH family outer membrane protein [Akkermansiaceae bacterium]
MTKTITSAKIIFTVITFALLASRVHAVEPKVASVNIDKVLLHYEAADRELSYLKSARERYLRDRNTDQKKINTLAIELKALQSKIKNKAMPRSERNNLLNQREKLVARYQSLTKKLQQDDDQQAANTKQQITSATKRILKHCHREIKAYAKTHGFQWVLETSGHSTSRISPLVYARHTVDITDDILALLNEELVP